MSTAKIDEIREARRALLAEGEPDTMDNVIARLGGGSKSTMTKYWSVTNPRDDPSVTSTLTTSAPAQSPEQAFRETWQQYLTAGMHALVILGIPGQPSDYTRGRPGTTAQNALPADHPWRQQILDDWHTCWRAHMDALARLRQKPTDAEIIALLESELEDLKQEAQANSEQSRVAGNQVRGYEQDERLQRLGPHHPEGLPYRQAKETFQNAYARSIELQTKIRSVSLQLEQRQLARQAGRLYYE